MQHLDVSINNIYWNELYMRMSTNGPISTWSYHIQSLHHCLYSSTQMVWEHEGPLRAIEVLCICLPHSSCCCQGEKWDTHNRTSEHLSLVSHVVQWYWMNYKFNETGRTLEERRTKKNFSALVLWRSTVLTENKCILCRHSEQWLTK